MEGAVGVGGAGVEVVSVFEAEGSDGGIPPEAAADGEEGLVEGVLVDGGGDASGVEEADKGPVAGDGLFEFEVGDGGAFGAELVAGGVDGRGFAVLIAAEGAFAAGEEAFIEGERAVVGGEVGGDAVPEAEVEVGGVGEGDVVAERGFEALVAGLSAEVGVGEFEGDGGAVAASGEEGVIAAFEGPVEDESGDSGILLGALVTAVVGVKELVGVAGAELLAEGGEGLAEAGAEFEFAALEGEFLAVQGIGVSEGGSFGAEEFGDGVGIAAEGGFEGLEAKESGVVAEAKEVELVDLESGEEEVIAAETEGDADVDGAAFEEGVADVAEVVGDFGVVEVDGLEDAEAGEAMAGAIGFEPVEVGAGELDLLAEEGFAGVPVALELDLAASDAGAADDLCLEVHGDDVLAGHAVEFTESHGGIGVALCEGRLGELIAHVLFPGKGVGLVEGARLAIEGWGVGSGTGLGGEGADAEEGAGQDVDGSGDAAGGVIEVLAGGLDLGGTEAAGFEFELEVAEGALELGGVEGAVRGKGEEAVGGVEEGAGLAGLERAEGFEVEPMEVVATAAMDVELDVGGGPFAGEVELGFRAAGEVGGGGIWGGELDLDGGLEEAFLDLHRAEELGGVLDEAGGEGGGEFLFGPELLQGQAGDAVVEEAESGDAEGGWGGRWG